MLNSKFQSVPLMAVKYYTSKNLAYISSEFSFSELSVAYIFMS